MNNTELHAKFLNMDFGTIPTTSTTQDVEICIDEHFFIDDYGVAVAKDLRRRNPQRFDLIDQEVASSHLPYASLCDAISAYVQGLVRIRLQSINDDCKDWRRAKELRIPAYVQFVLSQIGVVWDLDHGRRFVPRIEDTSVNIEDMLQISQLLAYFESDGVVFLKDAFPRSKDGDKETMSIAMVDGYTKGIERYPASKSYISVFLGMKLKEELTWRNLFSVNYDDIDFVRSMLLQELVSW